MELCKTECVADSIFSRKLDSGPVISDALLAPDEQTRLGEAQITPVPTVTDFSCGLDIEHLNCFG